MTRFYRMVYAFSRGLYEVMGVEWIHADRIPTTGGVIIAPNHRSYLDPPMAAAGLRREMNFFAKAELFDWPILGPTIRALNSIPVRRGEADRKSIAMAIRRVREGGALILFPEGTRSKTDAFLEPKLGVGMIAARAGKPVLPVYIHGTEGHIVGTILSAVFRKRKIRVIYGELIAASSSVAGDRSQGYRDTAERVMEAISALKLEYEEASAPVS